MIYFAYGSNLHLKQMKQRCPDAQPIKRAVLWGYKMIYRRGVATIEPASWNDKVYGALYRISKRDLVALDRYEGYPDLYYRDTVHVEVRKGAIVEAMTYMMHSHFQRSGPRPGYYQIIAEGYRNWGLPIKSLETTVKNLGSVRLSSTAKG